MRLDFAYGARASRPLARASAKGSDTPLDERSGRVVYVSSCVLNQNIRFPGIAVRGGAMSELVNLFMERGVGIEPLPCLERIAWGGVRRASVYRLLPLLFRYTRLARVLGRLWWWRYRRLCRREAKRVAAQIADYQRSGYDVIGIVAMNDSPTCGVTKTVDPFAFVAQLKARGLGYEALEHPKLEVLRAPLQDVLVAGQGVFTQALIAELRRRKSSVRCVGVDPWGDTAQEIERIRSDLLDAGPACRSCGNRCRGGDDD